MTQDTHDGDSRHIQNSLAVLILNRKLWILSIMHSLVPAWRPEESSREFQTLSPDRAAVCSPSLGAHRSVSGDQPT